MFLSEPGKTGYDLNFSLLGFPCRVHPAFFVLPLLFGQGLVASGRNLSGSELNTGVGLIVIAGLFFISILIHELGHAIAFRRFGIHSRIVLYWMGGLAIPDSGGAWSRPRSGSLTPNQQIIVSLAGPIFGLLIAVVFIVLVLAVGGRLEMHYGGYIPLPLPDLRGTFLEGNAVVMTLVFSGIAVNIFLNLLNLVPIYPLDGGQVARQVMLKFDAHNGIRNSLIVSIACAVLIAVVAFSKSEQFLGIFFGFMAYSNFQALQQFGGPRW
ncbi:MAG: metalloprotease [Mariniblastus sp.]